MLKIFNLIKKNNGKSRERSEIEILKRDYVGYIRYYLPANKEWFNSVYAYNKNVTKLLPWIDNFIISLIRGYFNMFSRKLERKVKLPVLKVWKRRLSVRKIWVSKCELKHANNKIIITLYIYNKQYNYLLKKLYRIMYDYSFNKKFDMLKQQLNLLFIFKKHNYKFSFNENLWNNLKKIFIIALAKKHFKIIILYIRYRQTILFNKFKFSNRYILPLKNLLYKIYNKNIEFNLVTLNNFYFNSDILAQILTSKIRNRKNTALKVLTASLRKTKTPVLNKRTIKRESVKLIDKQNSRINDFTAKPNTIEHSNYLDIFLKNKLFYSEDSIDIQKSIIDSIKYKIVSGVKVKASGRITRRIIAARAVYKFKYVGTLKNIDSSYKGLSSILVRGSEKSNIQYSFLKYKTRIGSFGLKGWVSGY